MTESPAAQRQTIADVIGDLVTHYPGTIVTVRKGATGDHATVQLHRRGTLWNVHIERVGDDDDD